MSIVVRRLKRADDRSNFDSGDIDLDRFFHRFAGQNQFRHHIGTTYVAVEHEAIVSYVTKCQRLFDCGLCGSRGDAAAA